METTRWQLRDVARRIVACVLALVLAMALVPAVALEPAQAVTDTTVDWTDSGTCEWSIDEDGLLTIRPADGASTGTLASWSSYTTPWYTYRSYITSVYVEEGVSAPSSTYYGLISGSSSLSLSYMFYGCTSLASVDLSNLDTSSVTDMSYMFYGCRSIVSLDLSSFDTSSVTDMSSMFEGCTRLQDVDLSSFDVSKVTDMSSMFAECSALVSPDLSSFFTPKLKTMSYMFQDCTSLETLDLSAFDTSLVTNMSFVFDGCTSLEYLDVTAFDTFCVTYMYYTFRNCTSLAYLDISSFDTTNTTYRYNMFSGCTALRTVIVGEGFEFSGVLYSSSSYSNALPAPVDDAYGEGCWQDGAGTFYEDPEDIPDNTAATYTAVFDTNNDGIYDLAISADGTTEATSFSSTLSFSDVTDESAWYYDAVYAMARAGYLTGYTSGSDAGKFGVGDAMTRAQFVTVLWRIACPSAYAAYDNDADNESGLSDVSDDVYYTAAVNWAVENGVVTGYTSGTYAGKFRPGANISFQDMCLVIARYAGGEDGSYDALTQTSAKALLTQFSDGSKVSSYAVRGMAWCVFYGLVEGSTTSSGAKKLSPASSSARERAAVVLYRAVSLGLL